MANTSRQRSIGKMLVVTTATLAATRGDHGGLVINLKRAAGITVTLPPAVGSGTKFQFILGASVTSNTTIIRVTGNDVMAGLAIQSQDAGATVQAWETAADSDTITFNGNTTGGLLGDVVELIDIDADLWAVQIRSAATGTEATPFSATVT